MDREKVIKGLKICRHRVISQENCMDCPYIYDGRSKQTNCEGVLHWDALALLKEQEAVKPWHKCIGNEFTLIEDSHFDFCPYCGRAVKWE